VRVRVYPSTSAPGSLQYKDGLALIDTGATRSGICKSVAESLHYKPVDFVGISHASGQSRNPVFPINFEFPGSGFPPFNGFPLVGFDLSSQDPELLMLLGRDFLLFGQLYYHGPSGFYEIIIPAPPRVSPDEKVPGIKSSKQEKQTKLKPQKLHKKRNKSRSKKRK